MNKDRRKAIDALIRDLEDAKADLGEVLGNLNSIVSKLEDAKGAIDTIKDEEQEFFDNMPEGFQNGEKGEAASAAVSALEEAHDKLGDEVITKIEDLAESIEGEIDEVIGGLETARDG